MITDLPTKRIKALSYKHLSKFYLQDGGKNQLAFTKIYHCHPIFIGNVCDLSDQVGERTSVVAIYAESCGKAVARRSWRSIAELVPAAG